MPLFATPPLERLSQLVATRAETEAMIEQTVEEARRADPQVSWAKIGHALGVSKAAAHQRYRSVDVS